MPFVHKKLAAYRRALEFFAWVHEACAELPRGSREQKEQLNRAALSIVLNTAEGAGEYSPKEKARFFRMALRSTNECAALLDVLKITGAEPKHLERPESILNEVAATLTGLIHANARN